MSPSEPTLGSAGFGPGQYSATPLGSDGFRCLPPRGRGPRATVFDPAGVGCAVLLPAGVYDPGLPSATPAGSHVLRRSFPGRWLRPNVFDPAGVGLLVSLGISASRT